MVYGTTESDLIPGENPFMVESKFWGDAGNGIAKCGVCPRFCEIRTGKTGFCGARYKYDDKLYAINYGLVSSAHIDPYEKKPLYHFHPGKFVLSLGGYGCNMACKHCQNCEISQRRITNLKGKYEYHPPEEILEQCRQNIVDGVSFTYNEPTIWLEYALDCSKLARSHGYRTSFVTNGYMTEDTLGTIGPHLDAANVDVKGYEDPTYGEISEVKNPEVILERIEEMVKRWNIHVEITTNVIPGYNYGDKTFMGIAKWIVSKLGPLTPWHITRYHPAHHLNNPATPLDVMLKGREIGRQAGLKFVYLGNIADPEGDQTTCPACGRIVMKRHGFSLADIHVTDEGKCGFCSEPLGIKM